jgi:hypothetical protein
MIVRRDGTSVLWEPFDTGHRETLHRGLAFELLQYLDAVDDAARVRPGEGRGRRVAREVIRRLRLSDEFDGGSPVRPPRGFAWISSWPWDSDTVTVLPDADHEEPRPLPPLPGESDGEYANRLHAMTEDMR